MTSPSNANGSAFLSAVVILVLLFLIISAGSAGFASLQAMHAARSGQPQSADAAVRFSSKNPQNHLIRAALFQRQGNISGAVAEYSRAASLRPDDYVLWLNLSHARELNGDLEGAIAASRYAVTLAPHYAKPHWQLGNLLVRAGRIDEGYRELRTAGTSNPALLPAFINLAWQLSRGNVQTVVRAAGPETPAAFQTLADFFRKRGRTSEAIEMFRRAGVEPGEGIVHERRAYLAELLGAKDFKSAHELWLLAHPSDPDLPLLFDGGFEQESDLDEPGFGWRAGEKSDAIQLSLDPSDPDEGRRSLQVVFNGGSDPSQPVISQLVPVEPQKRYQLRFALRTRDVVSGGLPLVAVIDPVSGLTLGQTEPFPQTISGWRGFSIEFTSAPNTQAIQIRLQRGPCSSPCPIFGNLWLDKFSLRVLGP